MNLSNAGRTRLGKIPGLNKALDFICARANEVFRQEHDNESGAHTAITAESVTLVVDEARTAIADIAASNVIVAGNVGNSLALSVNEVGVLTLQRIVDTLHTIAMVPSTANGTGPVTGNVCSIGRNTSGNGAAGSLKLIANAGAEWYFWATAAGVLRVANTPPFEDGSIPETYGTVVGGGLIWLGGGSGTSSATGATNLATVAISGLTRDDILEVMVTIVGVGGAITQPKVYDSSASVTLADLYAALTLADSVTIVSTAVIMNDQSGATRQNGLGVSVGGVTSRTVIASTYTGSWNMALRHEGLSAGSLRYRWSVSKRAGQ